MITDNMTDIEILTYLAKGYDLETGEKLDKSHFLRDPSVVAALYEAVLALQPSSKKAKKLNSDDTVIILPAMLTQIKRIEPTTTITYLAENISTVISISKGKVMKAIQNYLIEQGDLEIKEDVNDLNKPKKFATESGEKKGILNVDKPSSYGREYHTVQYTTEGQDYVISLLPEIFNR